MVFFSLVKVRTIYKYARLKRRFTTAFMLLINAVFNTTSYQEAEKKKVKPSLDQSEKSTVMRSIGNSGSTHTQLLLQIKTNQQPEITTELSSAIYQSMAKINRS